MKYQLCTAPLLDRSAVTSRRDFIELPLGDNQINSALAESFKGGVNAGNKGLEVSAKNESAYKAEFCGYTGDLMKSAKQKSTKQKVGRTMTITGMTDMLETKALSHVTYSVPNGELAKKTPILHPPGNLGPAGKWDGPAPSSSYKTEFCREYKRENSLPDIKALAMHTGTASALLPDHHPAFKTKRVGYMSPGIVITDLSLRDRGKMPPDRWEYVKKVFNIIADRVETVTPWLIEQVLANDKHGARIAWLTTRKAAGRFIKSRFKSPGNRFPELDLTDDQQAA